MEVTVRGLPPDTGFGVFSIEVSNGPFGLEHFQAKRIPGRQENALKQISRSAS
jgi:hypothetical protein